MLTRLECISHSRQRTTTRWWLCARTYLSGALDGKLSMFGSHTNTHTQCVEDVNVNICDEQSEKATAFSGVSRALHSPVFLIRIRSPGQRNTARWWWFYFIFHTNSKLYLQRISQTEIPYIHKYSPHNCSSEYFRITRCEKKLHRTHTHTYRTGAFLKILHDELKKKK